MKLFGKKKENLTWYGKTYESKEALRAAQKKAMKEASDKKKKSQKTFTKNLKSVGETVSKSIPILGLAIKAGKTLSQRKKSKEASIASGKTNTTASNKMKAAETSFRDSKAATRDIAKTKISDRSFKSTFDAAEKAGKSTFTYGGRDFMTNKGKGENRDKMKTRIAEKGVFKKKSNLDAKTVSSFKKRIKYMKDRKAKGKNFSAKNLKELEAKLAAN